MTRRDLLKHFGTMTAAAIALPIDLDRLIWVPKPIITVPSMPGISMRFIGNQHVSGYSVMLLAEGGVWRMAEWPSGHTIEWPVPAAVVNTIRG